MQKMEQSHDRCKSRVNTAELKRPSARHQGDSNCCSLETFWNFIEPFFVSAIYSLYDKLFKVDKLQCDIHRTRASVQQGKTRNKFQKHEWGTYQSALLPCSVFGVLNVKTVCLLRLSSPEQFLDSD
jgi:hypothetical protein